MSRGRTRILVAATLTLTLAGYAQARPTVEQQADAIYKAWMAADTPQNRALAKKQGKPVEATLSARIEEVYPPVPGKHHRTLEPRDVVDIDGNYKTVYKKSSERTQVPAGQTGTYPLFKRKVKEGAFSGGGKKYAGTRRWWNFSGPATLMITEKGPAYRTHKGFDAISRWWSGRVHKTYQHSYSEPRPLHWPLPKRVAKAFPGLAKKLGVMRAKRMIRKAVRSGRAPTPLQVRLAFHRAQRAKK
jgi:hypothetical protein